MKRQMFDVGIIGITFFAAFMAGCQNTATSTSDTSQVSMNTANGRMPFHRGLPALLRSPPSVR